MAVRDLLWGCPICRTPGGIRPRGKREVCRSCGATFRRSRGARILVENAGSREERSPGEWLAMLGPVTAPPADDDGVILGPERVRVKFTRGQEPLHWAGQLIGWVENYTTARPGLMALRTDGLHLRPARGPAVYWGPAEISGLQPASSSLQLGLHDRMASVKFVEGSVRLWTRALSDLLEGHLSRARTRCAGAESVCAYVSGQRVNSLDRVGVLPAPGPLYWFMHGAGRWFWPALGGFDLSGREHIPDSGPFLLISNHQSVLDPFFIQTWFTRPVHPMAKSTQFASPIFAAVMKRCYSFPVRRFQVDPQAVRTALRRLRAGHPVHIYVEGERTWDGSLRPPRPGTVRLALKAGVPILPCAVDGAYDVWPRWDRRFRRGRVRVAFGKPFMLPQIHDRARREAAVPEAGARIMSAISELLGVAPPVPGDDDT